MKPLTFPLVSVIIPTYNRSALLKETVDSVLAQTYPAIECVVVDDGSTDDTPQVLAQYGNRIINVRTANQGGTKARNVGIAAAHGEFLNFLDHDDLMLPTKIERQMEVLRARSKIGLVHCGYYRMDKDGHYLDVVNFLPEGDVRAVIVQGCFMWSGAPLIRRQVIDKVGVFDPEVYSSDQDLWLRIALADYRFGCVQEPLGAYRILPNSSMNDVEATERLDMPILKRVFADPRLPEEARRMRRRAYFNQRFWLACRYYAVGSWQDAQRNLKVALHLRREIAEQPSELVNLFIVNAFDPRVPDPLTFITNLLEHLPCEVKKTIDPLQSTMFAWVYFGLAMRKYASRDLEQARQNFLETIRLDSNLEQHSREYARSLVDYALRLPLQPLDYIKTVLANLPPEGQPLSRLRRLIISETSLARAFQDYWCGKRRLVPARVLTALYYRPGLVRNRGALAIFMRSLPALLPFIS
jgi:glycosyltransferase involved in cell wall biosynthesis